MQPACSESASAATYSKQPLNPDDALALVVRDGNQDQILHFESTEIVLSQLMS
jgi:hypothetical protein